MPEKFRECYSKASGKLPQIDKHVRRTFRVPTKDKFLKFREKDALKYYN